MSALAATYAKDTKENIVDTLTSTAGDFDPREILTSGIFSLSDTASSMDDLLAGGLSGFGANLLLALLPRPEVLGGAIAAATGVSKKETLKELGADAEESAIMDQVAVAKARGRRASSTAKKCEEPTCNKFHFRMDPYCADHKHLGTYTDSAARASTIALLKSENRDSEVRPDMLHHLKAIALREEMMSRAETFDIEITVDYVRDAKAALGKSKQLVDDAELGQFFFQFKRLDADGDGVFSVADFRAWILRIDPEFKSPDEVVQDWLKKATLDSADSFNFVMYYNMIMARREYEANNWGLPAGTEVPLEFKQTPFWDLRMIALHAITKDRGAWMLKRGYLFTKESLNSWKVRFVRTNSSTPGALPALEYWDADPGSTPDMYPVGVVTPAMKGSVPLSEIVLVDFSPKTGSPKGTDPKLLEVQTKVGMEPATELVLKITLVNGRRFTFACEEDKAVTWAAELSRHAAASRLMLDWRENWGTKRIGKVVLRDWLNAAVVIAKIGMQKNAQADAQKMIADASKKWTILPGQKAAAVRKAHRDASKYIMDLVLTERDKMMLRVVGLDDKTVDQLGTGALMGIRAWNASKDQLKYLDNQMCGGGVQMGVTGVITAVNVYNYAAAAKNAYNTNKWKVEWEPKSMQRACAVCCMTFKSMTLRKTHGKHHCRSCGKVVCHVCAANRIYMPVSDKFERVCTKCLTEKGSRTLDTEAAPNTVLTGVTDKLAAQKITNEGEGDDDSSDDSGGEN